MRRGEIRIVNLDPVVGSEASSERPAVIVSNDGANTTADRLGRGVVTVVPITTSIDRIYAFQTLLTSSETGLAHDSKAQAEQIRTLAIARIGRLVGAVPYEIMDRLDDAIRLHLDL